MNAQRNLVWSLAAVLLSIVSFAQELPPCSRQRVVYEPVDESFASKMVIELGSASIPSGLRNQSSPDGTRYLILRNPITANLGPGTL
jgi:hypothetical protein